MNRHGGTGYYLLISKESGSDVVRLKVSDHTIKKIINTLYKKYSDEEGPNFMKSQLSKSLNTNFQRTIG